jgi:hypothetical protein
LVELRNLQLAGGDLLLDGLGGLAIDAAADGHGGAEHLHDAALHVRSHGLALGLLGDLEDLREGNVAIVLDVLDLLAVTGGLLEGTDEAGRNRGGHGNGGDTVLDLELARHLQTLPVLGGLHDVLTDLLGVQTKGTDLGGKGGRSGHLATDGTDDDGDLLAGVELRGHAVAEGYNTLLYFVLVV